MTRKAQPNEAFFRGYMQLSEGASSGKVEVMKLAAIYYGQCLYYIPYDARKEL
jgi:hypothetical protein